MLVICLHIFNLVSTKLNTVSVRIWLLHLRSLVPKKQAGDRAFSVAGPHLWNELPSSVRTVDHMDRFKNKLKSHLFSWFFQAPWAHCKRRYINHIIIIIIIIIINTSVVKGVHMNPKEYHVAAVSWLNIWKKNLASPCKDPYGSRRWPPTRGHSTL